MVTPEAPGARGGLKAGCFFSKVTVPRLMDETDETKPKGGRPPQGSKPQQNAYGEHDIAAVHCVEPQINLAVSKPRDKSREFAPSALPAESRSDRPFGPPMHEKTPPHTQLAVRPENTNPL